MNNIYLLPIMVLLVFKYKFEYLVNISDLVIFIFGMILTFLYCIFYKNLSEQINDKKIYAILMPYYCFITVLVNTYEPINHAILKYPILQIILISSKFAVVYYAARVVEFSTKNNKKYIPIGLLLLVLGIVSIFEILLSIEALFEMIIIAYYFIAKIGDKNVEK